MQRSLHHVCARNAYSKILSQFSGGQPEDGQYGPKYVVTHFRIKYTSCDTVVFDYIHFPSFTHTTGMTHFLNLNFNLLTPNVNYSGRTAPLTSKVTFYIFIQQI